MKTLKTRSTAIITLGVYLIFPYLNTLPNKIAWHTNLLWLLIMAVSLALMFTGRFTKWWLILGTTTGLLGTIGEWQLLPLVLAQLGFSVVLWTQHLKLPVALTGILGQAAFMQLMLIYSANRFLNLTTILDVGLIFAPAVIVVWDKTLPRWLTFTLIGMVCVLGYFSQRMTILAIILTLLLSYLFSDRRLIRSSLFHIVFPILTSLILVLTRLHG